EADRLPAREQPRLLHRRAQPGDGQLLAGPEVDVHVERRALAREAGVARAPGLAALGAVDRGRVALQPGADRAEDAQRGLGDRAIRQRADVQQVVAAVAHAGDQVAHDLLRRLPVVVGGLVAPAPVHRHARLPGAALLRRLDALLRRAEVARQ